VILFHQNLVSIDDLWNLLAPREQSQLWAAYLLPWGFHSSFAGSLGLSPGTALISSYSTLVLQYLGDVKERLPGGWWKRRGSREMMFLGDRGTHDWASTCSPSRIWDPAFLH